MIDQQIESSESKEAIFGMMAVCHVCSVPNNTIIILITHEPEFVR